MEKLKLKLRFEFIKKRIDTISVALIVFIGALYLSNYFNFDPILIFILICSIFVFFLYKNIICFYLIIILAAVLLSISYYSWNGEYKYIRGELSFIGLNKVITVNKALWFSEKMYIEEDLFQFTNGSTLSCSGNFLINRLDNLELELQGVKNKISCKGRWRGEVEKNIFTEINANLSKNLNAFNTDSSQLLKGITLGIKPTKELNLAFQSIGLSHIIVISGFNITLVLTIVLGLFKKFKPVLKIILALILTNLFILIVGPTAPVIRAGIMGIIAFLSTMKWRNISYLRILLLSAIIMIFFDPYTIYSVSFQLSFLATAGVMLFTEKISNLFRSIFSIVREPFSQSIAASVFTIPLTTNVFSTFAPSFILSNILILPILSFASILAYIYIFIPISPLFIPLDFLSNIMIQITLYLSQYSNSNLLISSQTKNFINISYSIFLMIILILYLNKKNMLYRRIEKKRIIKYYS